ncbi:alpha/beta hydrolase [Bauldia sp.]|uniref:alpha/beta hydrolase n=1 Tax=Bauldia sp. TaxID=2575872 RepID=UPI003BAD7EAF
MWFIKIALVLVVVFGAVLLLLSFMQTRMLFPAYLVAPPPELPPSAVALDVETGAGEHLYGVHIPPAPSHSGERVVLLGFGGNAWNAACMAVLLHRLFPDRDVVTFHYRGYRPSTGRPSAAALLADAPILYDDVIDRLGPAQVVAVGYSIGTGVAAELASRRPLAGVILVSPFDNLEALAREHFPWAPVGLLLRHQMPAADAIRGATTPVAIIAAENDRIIPPRRTEAFRTAAANLVFDRTIPNVGHNDLYQTPAFEAAMTEALTRILEAGTQVTASQVAGTDATDAAALSSRGC